MEEEVAGSSPVIHIAADLIHSIEKHHREVLWDDRTNVTPHEKFSDADLIGIPVRIILSHRSLLNGGIEVKNRDKHNDQTLSIDTFLKLLKKASNQVTAQS